MSDGFATWRNAFGVFSGLSLLLLAGCHRPEHRTRVALPPIPPPAMTAPQPEAKPEVKPEPEVSAADLLFPHHTGDTWEMMEYVQGEPHHVQFAVVGDAKVGDKTRFVVEMKLDEQLA